STPPFQENGPNMYDPDDHSWTFTTSFTVTEESDYAFDYSILPPLTDFTCPEELCYHCVYDLTMILEDACGQALATSEEMLGTYELDQNGVLSFITQIPCPSPADQIATMQVPALEPGDYKLIKKLELSTVARDLYLQDFLEQQLNC